MRSTFFILKHHFEDEHGIPSRQSEALAFWFWKNWGVC